MKNWIINLLFLSICASSIGQIFPEGIAYQAQLRSVNGSILSDQTINVRFNLRSNTMTGEIIWQENHTITTSSIGHIELNIGQGTSTGVGTVSNFPDIKWGNSNYFIEMMIDENNTGNYASILTQQFMSVPYAYHSKTTDQKYKLSELSDVDTTGIEIGDILVWNGINWTPEGDDVTNNTDTIQFAFNSDSANYSQYSSYAFNCLQPTIVDSSNFAYLTDTSYFSFNTLNSIYSDSSTYSDTAFVSMYSLGNWGLNGNQINGNSNFIGSIDSSDVIFKTNNTTRMVIKANGKIGLGTNSPITDFHAENIDGVIFSGTTGIGSIPAEGPGTRMMWYPGKSAFRSGTVTNNRWDDVFTGEYSFAAGYNTRASGMYSVAFGNASTATGEGAFAVGLSAYSAGQYSFSAGHSPSAIGDYSIALGRAATANSIGAIAIGYHPTVDGDYAMSLGNYTYAFGDHSMAFGYHARSMHTGSFIYADQSSEGYIETTAANQFMVRAIGGYVFYTSTDLSTGVVLAPGAGSWSILSDSTKKQNITKVNSLDYTKLLDSIDVYSWNYKSQSDSIRHIGPMAQEFHSVFKFGNDPTTINSGDFDGINLVLLKGLNEKIKLIEIQDLKIKQLNQELETLRTRRIELESRIYQIEEKLNNDVDQNEITSDVNTH